MAILILCLVPGTWGAAGEAFVARAATPSITVTPTSVAAGATVTVTGAGWTPGESVQLLLRRSGVKGGEQIPVLGTASADGTGAFAGAPFTIPAATTAGSYQLIAQGFASSAERATADLQVSEGAPAITVNPSSVASGGTVTVAGTGWTPGESVQLTLQPVIRGGVLIPVLGTLATNEAGAFASGPITIPATTPAGSYVLVAQGSVTGTKRASTDLQVTAGTPPAGTPAITVNPPSAVAGAMVTVAGTGWTPGESVQLLLLRRSGVKGGEQIPVLGTASADGTGAFAGVPFTIPAATTAGSYLLIAQGFASGAERATADLQVISGAPAITVNPTTIAPNSSIVVAGTGFGPDEQVSIALTDGEVSISGVTQVSLGTALTDGAGTFTSVPLTVPFGVVGPARVVATGETSNLQTSANVTVNAPTPTLTIAPPALVTPGASLAATGAHFQPGETVTLSLVTLASTVPFGTATAGADGSFTASPAIPGTAPQGAATVVATGNTSHLSASASLTIGAPAVTLTLSPTSVTAGNPVALAGTGFVPGETVSIQISPFTPGGPLQGASTLPIPGPIPPTITLGSAIADTAGAVAIDALAIPATQTGATYVVTAAGQTSGRTAGAHLGVQAAPANPVLSILDPSHVAGQPYILTPGGLVMVSGANFPAGAQVLLALAGATTLTLGTVGADTQGAFGPFGVTVPAAVAPGSYTLQAVVGGSQQASLPVQVVSLSPTLTLSTTTLTPGAQVTVTGSGYAAGELVVLALDGAALATDPGTILADSQGSFAAGFTVPGSIDNGSNTLTGTGQASRAGYSLAVQGQLPQPTSYYFADGDTTSGARTTLSLLNPSGSSAQVTLTFLYPDQPKRQTTLTVPARSPLAIDLGQVAGTGRHISTIVSSSTRIGAQATVFYNGADDAISLGAQAPARRWYEAEGYTGGSFRESLLIANPNTGYANVDVRFLPFNGKPPKDVRFTVAPQSNLDVDAGRYMPRQSFSLIVTADQGVVIDRTIRFGAGHRGATVGHGIADASTIWQFAQGTSSADRQTFLTILNPNPSSAATVTATFYAADGTPAGSKTIVVGALRRGNIKLNGVLPNAGVAVTVSSSVPVVVESPLYSGPANLDRATAGLVVSGRNGGGLSWLFPGGSVAGGEADGYYLYNPGSTPNTVVATFYTGDGRTLQESILLAANGTGHLSTEGIGGPAHGTYAVRFTSTSQRVFVVEQQTLNAAAGQLDGTQGIAA